MVDRSLPGDIRSIGVLGAGTMGHGIAEAAALAGFQVTVYDLQRSFLDAGLEKIRRSLIKLRDRGLLDAEKSAEVLGRIRTTLDLADLVPLDLIIEAVPENLPVKAEVFRRLDELGSRAIFASNTSTIPISEIAASTSAPGRFVGLHFFNPPVLMPLVEVTRGDRTEQRTLDSVVAFAGALGKRVVVCRKDVPGFIVNRVLGPLLNEAALTVGRGQATVAEVDSAAVYSVGLPMGLFELADHTGIDVICNAAEALRSREPASPPPAPLFEEKLRQGRLGRKTGGGFYEYGEGTPRPAMDRDAARAVDPVALFSVAVNAAAWLLRNQVCSKEDLELSVRLGLGFPEGLLQMADRWGTDRVVAALREKERLYGPAYAPDPLLVEMSRRGDLGTASGRGFYEYASGGRAFEELVLRKSPPLAWIVLNRPQKLNTITPRMTEELEAAARDVASDGSIRVVVLTGSGERAFSAGADITTFSAGSPVKAFEMSRRMYEAFGAFERMPKPVIAAIDGFALGGGCELALACDFRLASESSQLGLTETNLGIMPGAGGTQRLARLVGISRAREMIYLGSRVTAAEALRVGLVDRVFANASFRSGVEEFAGRLAKRAPLSLSYAKQALSVASQTAPDLGQLFEAGAFAMLLSTQDAAEGMTSFLTKREPEFKGE